MSCELPRSLTLLITLDATPFSLHAKSSYATSELFVRSFKDEINPQLRTDPIILDIIEKNSVLISLRPVYTTLNLWHGTDKAGIRTNFTRSGTL